MQDDFDNGLGLPDDELATGTGMSELGEAGGGPEGEAEPAEHAPAGRRSGGARARKASPRSKSAGARKSAPKAKKKSAAKKAKKAGKGSKKKAAKRKAGSKK